jgi:hypothetical protein
LAFWILIETFVFAEARGLKISSLEGCERWHGMLNLNDEKGMMSSNIEQGTRNDER